MYSGGNRIRSSTAAYLYGGDNSYSFSRQETSEKTESFDLKSINEFVLREDFESIINDKDLFFGKFCQTLVEKEAKYDEQLSLSIEGNKVVVKGSELSGVKKSIELLRIAALEALKTRCEVNRIFIVITHDMFLREPSSETIDLTDWLSANSKGKMGRSFEFQGFIQPFLKDFFNSLSFDIKESKITQSIQTNSAIHPEKRDAIKITLKNDHQLAYPIVPAVIPSTKIPERSFYDYYKSQTLCDYSLTSSDKKIIKVHGIVLAVYGGEYFQTLMNSKMKEATSQSLEIDFPHRVIQDAMDSIYLGPKHVEEKLFSGEEVDVYGVLQFAHAYDLQALFKHMINLLILVSKPSDATMIRDLANLYKDADLHRLADHLSPSNSNIRV